MNHALSPGASPRAVTAALADLLRDASMEHHAHTLAAWGARSTADLEYLDEADFHDLGLPPIDGRKIRSLACAAMRSRGRRHSLPKPKRNTDWLPARWFVTNAQPQRSASQTPAAHTPATPKRPPCRRSSSQTPTVPPTPAAPPTPEAAPPIADAPPTPEARPRAATAPSPPPAALSPTASPRTVHFAVRGHSMVDLDVYDSDAESLGAAPADSAVIDDTLAATKAASAVDLAVGDDDDDDDVDFAVQDGESTWRTCPTIEFAVESAVESSNVVDMDFDICDDTSDDEPANAALTVTYVDDDGDDDDGDVDADDESFFAQLQRERARWDKEQAKLLTVIELQQRELHSRGLKAEERARSIATQFSDSISLFEARLIKMERDADGELASIRTLAEKILAAAEKPPDRNAAAATARRFDTLEVELRNLSQKLDALRTT
mmetsp:Transcript_27161/g.97030  ORF Transcript_27161/g.97030 Transcript_27161/m.97030 type:complete len:436 (-) Transcript_27161:161-1468(-)